MTLSALVLVAGLAVQNAPAPTPAAPASADALGQAYFLFVQALALENRGDVTGAIAAYRKAIEAAPNSADVRAELAELFARENRAGEAVTEALAALKVDAANAPAHRVLGFVQASLAEGTVDPTRRAALVNEAIGHFEQTLAGDAHDAGVQFTLGRLYVNSGRYADGISTLRAFLVDQPGYPDALSMLAQAYEATHQPSQAADALAEFVASQPAQVRAKTWLAELYEQAGRFKEAAATWSDLQAASPRSLEYRIRRASALANGDDLAGARRALLEITTDSPREISAWYLLSQVERRAGNAAAAEDAARQVSAIDPKDPRGPIAMAEVKSSRGDHRGAVDALTPFVSAPRDADIANGTYAQMAGDLATALAATGDRPRAVAVLQEARRRDPESQGLLFDLVGAYEKGNQIDEAEQLLRGVIATDGTNADVLNSLGYLLADHGKKLDEAVGLIKRALAIDANSPSYLDSLGWAYVKQARLDEARSPLERAAAAQPKTSVIQDHLGELYFQLKRYKDAADAWDRSLAGDRDGIDVGVVTKKRDQARALAGR